MFNPAHVFLRSVWPKLESKLFNKKCMPKIFSLSHIRGLLLLSVTTFTVIKKYVIEYLTVQIGSIPITQRNIECISLNKV